MGNIAGGSGAVANVEQVFGPLRSRLFDLTQLVVVDLNKFTPLKHVGYCKQTILENVFNFPAEQVIKHIESLQQLLNKLHLQPPHRAETINIGMAGGITFIYKGEEPIEEEEKDKQVDDFSDSIINELSIYKYTLEQVRNTIASPAAGVTEKKIKIKTNLSVKKLAALFRILNEYDDGKDKVLKAYASKNELHQAIITTLTSAEKENISESSFASKYYAEKLAGSEVADFWIDKFKSLSAAATRYKQDLLHAKDKIGKK